MCRFTTLLGPLTMPAVVGVILFAAAGTWRLPAVGGVLAILALFCLALVRFADPGMLAERRRPGPGNRDRLSRPLGALLLLGHWVIAGLDVGRFRWSPIAWDVQVAGLVGYAAAMVALFWAVRTNPFYSSVVRVQTERGHRTVEEGPYRFVRHPGYAASLLAISAGGVALGSWLAMVPLAVFAAVFLRRTLVEDSLLSRELTGYAAYRERVRYRLCPGVF